MENTALAEKPLVGQPLPKPVDKKQSSETNKPALYAASIPTGQVLSGMGENYQEKLHGGFSKVQFVSETVGWMIDTTSHCDGYELSTANVLRGITSMVTVPVLTSLKVARLNDEKVGRFWKEYVNKYMTHKHGLFEAGARLPIPTKVHRKPVVKNPPEDARSNEYMIRPKAKLTMALEADYELFKHLTRQKDFFQSPTPKKGEAELVEKQLLTDENGWVLVKNPYKEGGKLIRVMKNGKLISRNEYTLAHEEAYEDFDEEFIAAGRHDTSGLRFRLRLHDAASDIVMSALSHDDVRKKMREDKSPNIANIVLDHLEKTYPNIKKDLADSSVSGGIEKIAAQLAHIGVTTSFLPNRVYDPNRLPDSYHVGNAGYLLSVSYNEDRKKDSHALHMEYTLAHNHFTGRKARQMLNSVRIDTIVESQRDATQDPGMGAPAETQSFGFSIDELDTLCRAFGLLDPINPIPTPEGAQIAEGKTRAVPAWSISCEQEFDMLPTAIRKELHNKLETEGRKFLKNLGKEEPLKATLRKSVETSLRSIDTWNDRHPREEKQQLEQVNTLLKQLGHKSQRKKGEPVLPVAEQLEHARATLQEYKTMFTEAQRSNEKFEQLYDQLVRSIFNPTQTVVNELMAKAIWERTDYPFLSISDWKDSEHTSGNLAPLYLAGPKVFRRNSITGEIEGVDTGALAEFCYNFYLEKGNARIFGGPALVRAERTVGLDDASAWTVSKATDAMRGAARKVHRSGSHREGGFYSPNTISKSELDEFTAQCNEVNTFLPESVRLDPQEGEFKTVDAYMFNASGHLTSRNGEEKAGMRFSVDAEREEFKVIFRPFLEKILADETPKKEDIAVFLTDEKIMKDETLLATRSTRLMDTSRDYAAHEAARQEQPVESDGDNPMIDKLKKALYAVYPAAQSNPRIAILIEDPVRFHTTLSDLFTPTRLDKATQFLKHFLKGPPEDFDVLFRFLKDYVQIFQKPEAVDRMREYMKEWVTSDGNNATHALRAFATAPALA